MIRRGLMLLEVLVAVAILAAVLLPMLAAIDQSMRAVHAGGDHTDALALAQRSVEDLLCASQDADCADGFTSAVTPKSRPVVDPLDPLGFVIEDTHATWGRLERRVDVGLDERAGETFRQYRDFRLSIQDSSPDGGDGVIEATVELSCPTRDARQRSFLFPLALSFTSPVQEPRAEEPPAMVEAAIVSAVFEVPGGALERRSEDAGAAPQVVRDLGLMLVVCEALAVEDAGIDRVIMEARASAAAPGVDALARAEHELAAARAFERRASLSRAALLTCAPPLDRLARALTRRAVGTTRFERLTVTLRLVSLIQDRVQRFTEDVEASLRAYLAARAPLATVGVRRQRLLALDRKVLDLAILRRLLVAEPDGFLTAWAAYLLERYRGRNRYLEALVTAEAPSFRDLDLLQRRHPGVTRSLERLRAVERAAKTVRERAVRELRASR